MTMEEQMKQFLESSIAQLNKIKTGEEEMKSELRSS